MANGSVAAGVDPVLESGLSFALRAACCKLARYSCKRCEASGSVYSLLDTNPTRGRCNASAVSVARPAGGRLDEFTLKWGLPNDTLGKVPALTDGLRFCGGGWPEIPGVVQDWGTGH